MNESRNDALSLHGLLKGKGGGSEAVKTASANFTLDGTYANAYTRCTAGLVVTLPTTPTDIKVGDTFTFRQLSGAIGISVPLAVTFNLPYGSNNPNTAGIGATIVLRYVDIDVWDAEGDFFPY